MKIVLVNTNRMKPPISPIGLEYVAEALNAAGHDVAVLDLCWVEDWRSVVAEFFRYWEFDVVGVTLRNTDDCAFTSRQSFLGEFSEIVREISAHTEAPIVVGGVGFSVMPEEVLELCGLEIGIWGDGEFAFASLADCAEGREKLNRVPNLVFRLDGKWYRNPPSTRGLGALPDMTRSWVDNRRYFHEGGQIGFESKRGCDRRCVYCADPVAKGTTIRLRPPVDVVDELEALVRQGIDHFHTCDSEFNLPPEHAVEVCRMIAARGLGNVIRWYAYCTPAAFSPELACWMRKAGCAGINFGVDSGDPTMLKRLGREFTAEDIVNATRWCKRAGMAVMLDLLVGSPGESKRSIRRTIELMKRAEPDRVGVAVGVRVYPGTRLHRLAMAGKLREGLRGGQGIDDPLFFLEPRVADSVFELLDGLVASDPRFFFFDPNKPQRNYNYNQNERLMEAIRQGYRGAYWDILRRYG